MPTRWLASLLSVDWLKAMRDRHLCSPDRLEILIDRAASEGKMTSGEADYLAVQAVVYEGGGGEVELHVLIYPAIEKVLPDDSAEARRWASLLEQAVATTVFPAVVGVGISRDCGPEVMEGVLFFKYDEHSREVWLQVPSSTWPREGGDALPRDEAGPSPETRLGGSALEAGTTPPSEMEGMTGRRHYNNGEAEFILEPVSPSVVRVEHRDQVGRIGINKNWDVLQPFAFATSGFQVADDGIKGTYFGYDTPDNALRALARHMLNDQRKADSQRVNPGERQNAARQVLREFLDGLDG